MSEKVKENAAISSTRLTLLKHYQKWSIRSFCFSLDRLSKSNW